MTDIYLNPPDGPPVYLGRGELDDTGGAVTLDMEHVEPEVRP